MTSLKRILCAIDLERASEPAFERALSLAQISKATLYLVHATPANVRFSSRSRERFEYLSGLRTRAKAQGSARASMNNTATLLRSSSCTRMRDEWIWSCLAPIVDEVGAGCAKAQCPSGCSVAQHGRS
jgi:hypothetical protein